MNRRLVVVGASLAGLRAVEAARRAGFDGDVVLVGNESHLPYNRPPLSKRYLVGEVAADFYRTEEQLRDELRVDLRLNTTAVALDPKTRVVRTTGGDIPYDALVIATGVAPRTLPEVPAIDGIVTLRTLGDADGLRDRIVPGSQVMVVGAGFIGSEIASSVSQLGAHPTLVEAAAAPLVRVLGPKVGAALTTLHPRNGTQLFLETQIVEVLGRSGRVCAVRLSNGEELPADVVVVGIGAAPATAWLEGSGIALHEGDRGVICDAYLQTSLPGIYAAGDVAHWPNAAFGMRMRLENWTNATEQAAVAALNAIGVAPPEVYETVPYLWSDWYGHRIQFTGIASGDAEFVSGSPDEDKFVAVYREGDRVVGAATLNEPRKNMKLRRIIAERGGLRGVEAILAATAQRRTTAQTGSPLAPA